MGAMDTTHPTWFKESFLDFEEDIAQATAEGKRLVLYFWQTGCPYCNALVEHNFTQRDITQTMREDFDLVAINMWGDREIIQVGGQEFSEKTLAGALKVQYTPTLLFFDETRKVILRLNGYYPPNDFRKALAYAGNQGEKHGTFADYLANQAGSSADSALHTEEFFEAPPYDLSLQSGRALAVYFEQGQCRQCDTLHQQLLSGALPRGRTGRVTVFILGRYRNERSALPADWKTAFGSTMEVEFLTAHRSKGREADYVILPGMVNRGFPSLRSDDPVLSLAMPEGDAFPLGEERRLFYVALTRARRSVAMFTLQGKHSPFLDELVQDGVVEVTSLSGVAINEERCPVCKVGVFVERNGPHGAFRSCSSYPLCHNKPKGGRRA